MKEFIIILILIIPAFLFGQETKKIKDKEKNEVYCVLKSNESIKHGSYQMNGNGKSRLKGFYKNGLKDSIWELYNYEGKLECKYDYTNKKLLYYVNEFFKKDEKYKVLRGTDTIKTFLDSPAIYMGGEDFIYDWIAKNIFYPAEAKEKGITGKVYISFVVDKNGKAINHKVIRGCGGGCDEEALRVVRSLPDNWIPANYKGEFFDSAFNLPIVFELR